MGKKHNTPKTTPKKKTTGRKTAARKTTAAKTTAAPKTTAVEKIISHTELNKNLTLADLPLFLQGDAANNNG